MKLSKLIIDLISLTSIFFLDKLIKYYYFYLAYYFKHPTIENFIYIALLL